MQPVFASIPPQKSNALKEIGQSVFTILILVFTFIVSRSEWDSILSLEWSTFVIIGTRVMVMGCLFAMIIACIGYYAHARHTFNRTIHYLVLYTTYMAACFSTYVIGYHLYDRFLTPKVEIQVPKDFEGEFAIIIRKTLDRSWQTEGRAFKYAIPANGTLEVETGYFTYHLSKLTLTTDIGKLIPFYTNIGHSTRFYSCDKDRKLASGELLITCTIGSIFPRATPKNANPFSDFKDL